MWVAEPTCEAMLEGIRNRRVCGATDNILADVRSRGHFMGEEFETSQAPRIELSLHGTADFERVAIIKDGRYVQSSSPRSQQAKLALTHTSAQRGETSCYIRARRTGRQRDRLGEPNVEHLPISRVPSGRTERPCTPHRNAPTRNHHGGPIKGHFQTHLSAANTARDETG